MSQCILIQFFKLNKNELISIFAFIKLTEHFNLFFVFFFLKTNHLLCDWFEVVPFSLNDIPSLCYKLKMIQIAVNLEKPLVVGRMLYWPPNSGQLVYIPCIIHSS